MPEKSARHLRKCDLNQIQPGGVHWRMHILKPAGAGCQIGAGFFGGVGQMMIKNDAEGSVWRIMRVQSLKERDERATAVCPLAIFLLHK